VEVRSSKVFAGAFEAIN